MKLVKLDAIDSTNDFLKELSANSEAENFTVVTAENQTRGKGQMGAIWNSEIGKNLIMSMLIKNFLLDINDIYDLNIIVSNAVIDALEGFKIPKLSIKWPNDIMSDSKKIGGILIENSIKSDGSINSVVGLGLNVNQTNFENLPKASSLALLCHAHFDKEEILFKIVKNIETNIQKWDAASRELWSQYTSGLFKKDVPMPFEDPSGNRFMGIIKGVSKPGKLQVLLEDDTVKEFNIKEIQLLF
jgi:BirA family biotin operon repressor/biotin-[acetyl-CoA-carboxylase] ligase